MGYYTFFTLSILKDEQEVDYKEVEGMEQAIEEEFKDYGNPFDESCKWYEHDEDMKRLSKKFPDLVFKLHGGGEESGDIWTTYYKDGKMQHCPAKITYDPFNPDELK